MNNDLAIASVGSPVERKFPKIIFQSWFLYLAIFGLILGLVDGEFLRISRLNYLGNQDGFVRDYLAGSVPTTPDDFRARLPFLRETARYIEHRALAYANLGFFYHEAGDFLKAVKYYKKAIHEDSRWYAFYFDLGVIYLANGQREEARSYLEQARDQLGNNLLLLKQLAAAPMADSAHLNQEITAMLMRFQGDQQVLNSLLTQEQNFFMPPSLLHYFEMGSVYKIYSMTGLGLTTAKTNFSMNKIIIGLWTNR